MKKEIKDRIAAFREQMKKRELAAYVVPTADFHNSEYVGDYFKVREYLSGFSGSNGTLVVTKKESGLWTDGRYFIQAEKELEGTGITLYRIGNKGVPTIAEYLGRVLQKQDRIGFDGRVCTKSYVDGMLAECGEKELTVCCDEDLAEEIWQDRPKRAAEKIIVMPDDITGCSTDKKIEQIRTEMKKHHAEYFFLSRLDDIMWLYNIRGNDVECNPVALSYAFLTLQEQYLFIQSGAMGDTERICLEEKQIQIREYDEVFKFLENYSYQGKLLMDEYNTSYRIWQILSRGTETVFAKNPTELLKAVKNETELKVLKDFYIKDSAAVCKFLYWIKRGNAPDELCAAAYLDGLRAEIEGFFGLSFPTISAYGKNAAMMHYEASKESSSQLQKKGMLLVDSGGQYLGATTDVTRTICLGALSEEEKKYFTLVAVGMLRLMNARFLHGCSGRNLDILAREPLWNCHVDYKCGTGHGVGAFLNVHEGPQSIRWKYLPYTLETVLEEGMLVTDEPGVYFKDRFGIRTENVLLVQKEAENEDGSFLRFETLTFVPIDLEGIETKYMNQDDKNMLNAYHGLVYEKIAPYLEEKERNWLKEVTKKI